VPDGVCVVWAGFLDEPSEVVRSRPHLMLVTACGSQSVSHVVATRLLTISIAMVGRGPLETLLAPIFATLDALLGVAGGNIGRLLLAAAQGHLPTS
jgi:hypothetical protein